jgi:ComF family protein
LYKQEEVICFKCLYHLPRTNFSFHRINPVSEIFWGRIDLDAVTSFLFFNKSGKVQRLMHNLKYRGRKDIGIFLGNLLGNELDKSPLFRNIDTVIPVPLHPIKQRKRGYNQSALIASGVSQAMKIELHLNNLVKVSNTASQTKKSRYERWKNVKNVFVITNEDALKHKHVLLVDDVITTGATIEASAQALKSVEGVSVSVASLAYAQG